MIKKIFFITLVSLFSCKSKIEKVTPVLASISESIYASGIIKSKNQYEAFVTVNGNIEQIFVTEGDNVKVGTPILSIASEAQKLNRDNALLSVEFAELSANQDKLSDAKSMIVLAKNKLENDSILFFRQKSLWKDSIGTKVELEARELGYQNAKAAQTTAKVKYNDLLRQLNFSALQSKKNLQISQKQENDYTLYSKIAGKVYSISKEKGEIVSPQMPLAVIGDAKIFVLEMQVDEYDILKIRNGLLVLVSMDSYKNKVFEARITKVFPIMNERSKTFLVEAVLTNPPTVLYPNISFEANIVLQTKSNALLIPRNYLLNDSLVIKKNGDKVVVKTGLKDYQKVEILSGINVEDELKKPEK
jgi:HlyD family secretion protein